MMLEIDPNGLDDRPRALLSLVGDVALAAGACTDAAIEGWPQEGGAPGAATLRRSLFTQFYCFYLHLMDRLAFGRNGDAGSAALQELLAPILFLYVDEYLESRPGQRGETTAEQRDAAEVLFFEQLGASHAAYGRCQSFDEMVGQLAEHLTGALGNPDQMPSTADLVRRHGQAIGERVEAAMRALEVDVD